MISQKIIDDFHRREFGEELARVNALPRAQRWAYIRKLWERIKRKQQEGKMVKQPHGPERIWGEFAAQFETEKASDE